MKSVRLLLFAFAMAIAVECCAAYCRRIDGPARPYPEPELQGEPLDVISKVIEKEAAQGVDLIVLPETWSGQNATSIETLDGPTTRACPRLHENTTRTLFPPSITMIKGDG